MKKQISLIRFICDNFLEDEHKLSILLPPENLLETNKFNTKQKYIRGGLRWNAEEHNRENDITHMNAEYGREIMLNLINHLN